MKNFSISEAIKTGWEVFKGNWQIVLLALGISIGVSILGSVVGGVLSQNSNNVVQILAVVVNLAFTILQMVLSIGLLKIAIMLVSGEKPNISEMWSNYNLIVYYLVMSIVMALIVGVGFVLLIIPGIYLALRLQLAPYFLVDKRVGPVQALKMSWGATKGKVLSLLGLDIVLGLVNLVGVLLLVVGLAVTAPVTMLAMASVYRKLSS